MALKDFKFENLPPSRQYVVLGIVALALAAIVYMYYLKDMVTQRSTLAQEVAKLEVSVAQATAAASRFNQVKKEMADLEERLRILRTVLPDQKLTPVVLRSVQEMATLSNLKLVKFNPKPLVSRAFHADWPISVETQGSYHALGKFFERISKSTRIINVGNISLKGIENSTDPTHTLNAACTATTFVFREEMLGATGK
jgi:type IV pilus assembly protein PilO